MKFELPPIQNLFKSKNLFFESYDVSTFTDDFLKISKTLKKTANLPQQSLVIVDDKNPYRFLCSVFGCINAGYIPCLWNWFLDTEHEHQILSENKYKAKIKEGIFYSKTESFPIHSNSTTTPLHSTDEFRISYSSKIIILSSGTTRMKACLLMLENLFLNAQSSNRHIPFTEEQTWGLCLPHFHVGGFSISIRALLGGGSIQTTNLHTENNKITHLSVVPTQLYRLKKNPFPNLKCCLVGGSKIDKNLIQQRYKEFPLFLSYGMTEMGSQVATSYRVDNPDSTPLILLPHSDIQIKESHIYVRGPTLFKGYLINNTPELHTENGFFKTSDLGLLKPPYLEILGRSDRIFQSGGENLSCEKIESKILKNCLNIKIHNLRIDFEPDAEYGSIPVCYIDCDEFHPNLIHQINKHLTGLEKIRHLYPLIPNTWKQEI